MANENKQIVLVAVHFMNGDIAAETELMEQLKDFMIGRGYEWETSSNVLITGRPFLGSRNASCATLSRVRKAPTLVDFVNDGWRNSA